MQYQLGFITILSTGFIIAVNMYYVLRELVNLLRLISIYSINVINRCLEPTKEEKLNKEWQEEADRRRAKALGLLTVEKFPNLFKETFEREDKEDKSDYKTFTQWDINLDMPEIVEDSADEKLSQRSVNLAKPVQKEKKVKLLEPKPEKEEDVFS